MLRWIMPPGSTPPGAPDVFVDVKEYERVRCLLARILATPAVAMVVGMSHAMECNCHVCQARAEVFEIDPTRHKPN